MKTLTELIAETRAEKNLTQQEVADSLQIGQSYYSALEKGHMPLSDKMLTKIAKVLDIPKLKVILAKNYNEVKKQPEEIQKKFRIIYKML